MENVLSSEPRIDGCYVAMNLAVNKQENPSPSNSLRPHSVKAKSRQKSFRKLKAYIHWIAIPARNSSWRHSWKSERGLRNQSACSAGAETIIDYYCLLVWCERKILFWLEIYDRLRPSEQAEWSPAGPPVSYFHYCLRYLSPNQMLSKCMCFKSVT